MDQKSKSVKHFININTFKNYFYKWRFLEGRKVLSNITIMILKYHFKVTS